MVEVMEVSIINWQIIIKITVVAYKQIIIIIIITIHFTIKDIIMDRIINYIKAMITFKIKDSYSLENTMAAFIRINNYFICIFTNIIDYIQGHTFHSGLSFYFFSSFHKLKSQFIKT